MDFQWLKTQFDCNPGKTKAGLAEAIGLEPPAISKILKGTRQIKAHEYMKMREYFGLPVDGERALKPGNSAYVIKPMESAETALEDNEITPETDWIIPADVVSLHTQTPSENVKIFTVRENFMEPDFKRGEHVIVDTSDLEPTPPGIFIISDGFGHLVRQCEYVAGSNPPKIRISAKDKNFVPQILENDDFEILGRVIAKLQWL